MASSPQIVHPLDAYLHTTYRPDCDYVDGQILERNVGEGEHSFVQGFLVALFWQHQKEWKVLVYPEQRIQVSATRYRIPDVCVVSDQSRFESVLTRPPLLCIEILSSEDRWPRITQRLEDYRSMGVRNLWVIDPMESKAWLWSTNKPRSDWEETAMLSIPETPIKVDAASIFAELAEGKKTI
ncbi:MAG TPA: Uma2 family endonuclease [Silvibacterium sp.]|nr:Uma2 family endonuclease [Silvibacterium sp.]